MHMKKIELLGPRDLRHFHRQRQSVIGRGKQRIMRNINSMEMKIILRQVPPNGVSITEEKNFVTAARKFCPHRCAPDPRPANQRKTRYANLERPGLHYSSV